MRHQGPTGQEERVTASPTTSRRYSHYSPWNSEQVHRASRYFVPPIYPESSAVPHTALLSGNESVYHGSSRFAPQSPYRSHAVSSQSPRSVLRPDLEEEAKEHGGEVAKLFREVARLSREVAAQGVRLNRMDNLLERMDARLERMDARLELMEGAQRDIADMLRVANQRLDRVENRLGHLETNVQGLLDLTATIGSAYSRFNRTLPTCNIVDYPIVYSAERALDDVSDATATSTPRERKF